MLSQRNRLKQTDEIATIFRRGKGFHSPFFSVKYVHRESSQNTRLAFSLGKKYLSRAVERNRLKRVIVGEIQKTPKNLVLGLDMVFFLTKVPNLADKKGIQQSVAEFLKKISLKN